LREETDEGLQSWKANSMGKGERWVGLWGSEKRAVVGPRGGKRMQRTDNKLESIGGHELMRKSSTQQRTEVGRDKGGEKRSPFHIVQNRWRWRESGTGNWCIRFCLEGRKA